MSDRHTKRSHMDHLPWTALTTGETVPLLEYMLVDNDGGKVMDYCDKDTALALVEFSKNALLTRGKKG